MTQMQVEFQKAQETARANRAKERIAEGEYYDVYGYTQGNRPSSKMSRFQYSELQRQLSNLQDRAESLLKWFVPTSKTTTTDKGTETTTSGLLWR